jgi:hypothetical protein
MYPRKLQYSTQTTLKLRGYGFMERENWILMIIFGLKREIDGQRIDAAE